MGVNVKCLVGEERKKRDPDECVLESVNAIEETTRLLLLLLLLVVSLRILTYRERVLVDGNFIQPPRQR